MKRLSLLVLAFVLACSCAEGKTGILAPMGQDEESVRKTLSKSGAKMDEVVIFDNARDMLMALRAGKIDRFEMGGRTAGYIAMRNKDFGLLVNDRNAIVGYSLAMLTRGNKTTMSKINSAIIRMKSDGTLKHLVDHNIIKVKGNDPVAVKMPAVKGSGVLRVAVTGDLPPMDCILADGRPAGFNTAFLAKISRRTGYKIELVSVSAGARQAALASGRVDAVFWTRIAYENDRRTRAYDIDSTEGLIVSEPYIFESRAVVSLRNN